MQGLHYWQMTLLKTLHIHKHTTEPPTMQKISSQIYHTGEQKRDCMSLYTQYVSILVIWLQMCLFLMYANVYLSSTQVHSRTHKHTCARLATLLYPFVRVTLWGSISPGWTIYPHHLMLNPIQCKQLYPFSPLCRTVTSSLSGAATNIHTQCTNAPRSVQLSATE